jgi:hypothetical protein
MITVLMVGAAVLVLLADGCWCLCCLAGMCRAAQLFCAAVLPW